MIRRALLPLALLVLIGGDFGAVRAASLEGSDLGAGASRHSGSAPERSAAFDAPAGQALVSPDAYLDPFTHEPVAPNAPRAVLVELEGETAFDLYRKKQNLQVLDIGLSMRDARPSVDAREAAFATMAARQAAPLAAADALGVQVVSRYRSAMNGFLAYATAEQIEALAAVGGVRRVMPAPVHVPLVEDLVPMIGADRLATELGITGEDVSIAVIDTGIDYTHKSLGGTGRTNDFADAYSQPAKSKRQYFPNDKVVGGWDFVGSNYVGNNTPQPDDNPLDERGHGSHVAGIAAGGTGNRALGQGVARDAMLIALKVFGRQGSTNLATDAIEWAIEANMGERPDGICTMSPACRVDVINMSLGSPFANDVLEQAEVIDRAADAGIVVVASAGNDGQVGFITGAPAASAKALSVASSIAGGEKADQVQILGEDGSGELVEALEASSDISSAMKDVKNLRGPLAMMGRGCTGDNPVQDVRNAVALVELGACSEQAKLKNVKDAGGVAMLAYAEDSLIFQMQGSQKTDIPAYMIPDEVALDIKTRLENGESLDAVLSYQWHESIDREYLADTISTFSSRGPSRLGVLKPNISAPGTNINAPSVSTGTEGTKLSGTSMAAPAVAGAAALMIERARTEGLAGGDSPALDAVDIGVLLVNTADHRVWRGDARDGEAVGLARSGSGRTDVMLGAQATTLLRAGTRRPDSPGTPFGITFGVPTFAEATSIDAPFFLRNLGDSERHYAVSTEFLFDDDAGSGVSFAVSEPTVTLDPGGISDLTLTVDLDPADMKPYVGYGGDAAMADAKLTDGEHDAFIVATEVDDSGQPIEGGDVVRLPVYVLPRAASNIAIEGGKIAIDPASGVGNGSARNAGEQDGRVELYVPLGEDDTEANVPPGIDIDRVGIRVGRDTRGERIVEFLIHTRETRLMPLQARAEIAIDTDLNGSYDVIVFNEDLGVWPPSPYSRYNGSQVAVMTTIERQSPLQISGDARRYRVEYYAGVDIESRTIVLPVRAALLGFGSGDDIKLNVLTRLRDSFSDEMNGETRDRMDAAPDGAWTPTGLAGGAFFSFDETEIGYSIPSWSFQVGAGGTFPLRLTRQAGAPEDPSPLLAYFPLNGPNNGRADDLKLVPVVIEAAPTATPTPTKTTTSHDIFLPALKREAQANN